MERKDIDINETWDLSQIYESNDLFYKDLETSKELRLPITKFINTF